MGRELQKKKRRSGHPKIRQKPKPRVPNPKSNAIIAAHWDHKLSLAQNYLRLGLTSKLNAQAGGVEKTGVHIPDANNLTPGLQADSLAIKPQQFTATEVQVERDPTTGAILRVTDETRKTSLDNPLNDPLNDILDRSITVGVTGSAKQLQTKIISELERQVDSEVKKAPRQQSKREEEWIEALVDKYGEDYERMVRDRKLNPMQQSLGDIKKRVKKWRIKQGKAKV